MESKDRITEILSDKSGLEMETLEKINNSCTGLSDEQKGRIFDIIKQKESADNSENRYDKEEFMSAKVIEYRRNNNMMKYIAAVAACACLVSGIIFQKNGTDTDYGNNEIKITTLNEISTVPENTKTTSSENIVTNISENAVLNASENPVTAIPDQLNTAPSKVTEIVAVSEKSTEESEGSASDHNAEVSAENQSQTAKAAKELKNLKDYFLNEQVDYSNDPMAQALTSAGLNEEQIYKLMRAEIFTKFADRVITDSSEKNYLGNSEYLTGYSYNSYCDLINYFFTEDGTFGSYPAEKAINMWNTGSVDGELKMISTSPVSSGYDYCFAKIQESSDSYIKVMIDCEELCEISELVNKGLVAEKEIADTNDVAALINEKLISSGYYGEYFSEAEITPNEYVVLHFRYTEEMIKTDEGWKLSSYQDFRRR